MKNKKVANNVRCIVIPGTQSIYLEEIIIGNNSRLDKQARKVLFKVSSFLEK